MRRTTISQGGQVQVPADVRRRWGTRDVLMEERGNSLVIRPVPDDPIVAALATLAGPGPTSDEILRQTREEEAELQERKARP